MPAKRTSKPAAEEEMESEVKKEKNAETPCLKRVRELDSGESTKFHTKMGSGKVPAWVKKYYEENLKSVQQRKSQDKVDFMRNVLENDDYEVAFFKRLKTMTHRTETTVAKEWMSWTEFSGKEGLAVAEAMLAQKTVTTQLHPGLNHNHKST